MAERTPKRTRLIDVAQDVGVSVQVVSAVLNGGKSNIGASQATRQKVNEAARRLGYRCHSAASALRKQEYGRIGLLMGGVEEHVFLPQGVLVGLTKALGEHGVSLTLDSVVLQRPDAIRTSRLLSQDCVDALLVALSDEPDPRLVRELNSAGRPVLWLHREVKRNSVGYDEADATVRLVKHLGQRGHRTIHLIDLNAPTDQSFAPRQRREAFGQACSELGIQGHTDYAKLVPRSERGRFAADWLAEHPEPTAVILGSCSAAQVFLDTAHQIGRDVPGSLALATFDNGSLCTANSPAITAAVFPELELGTTAGEMAIRLSRDPDTQLAHRRLRCELSIGGTT